MKTDRKKYVYAGLLALVFGMITMSANAQVSLSGEVRPRTEYRNGFKKLIGPNEGPALFTEQRSRLKFSYTSETFDVYISLQDIRIWGAARQIFKADPSLTALNEAWAAYHFSPALSLKLGRMQLDYDNARFLGNLEWAQQGRSHDLALLKYEAESTKAHLGVAFNQDANTPEYAKLTSTFYSGVANYKTMQYLWLHQDFTSANVSLLALNNGVQAGTDSTSVVNFSQTIGVNGSYKAGDFVFGGEFYQQLGKTGGGTTLNAQLIAANATYKGLGKTVITVGGDYLSGTESDATENNSFTPLYGTNHKFYGFMDYFYVGNPHGGVGLVDIYGKVVTPLGDKSKLIGFIHNFSSPVDIADPADANSTMSSGLGTEIDLVYNLNLKENVNLKVGYSQLLATETMEVLKGGSKDEINNWAWVMMTFKPKFL